MLKGSVEETKIEAGLELAALLDKSETITTDTEYAYARQKAIGHKPTLVFSGEGLKQYPLSFPLHFSFCNPDEEIQKLQSKAKRGEVISYYQKDEYIGEFVITRINISYLSKIKDITLSATVDLELTEYPTDEDEEFKNQNKNPKNPDGEVKSTLIQKPTPPVVLSSLDNEEFYITDANLDDALRIGSNYLFDMLNGIIDDDRL